MFSNKVISLTEYDAHPRSSTPNHPLPLWHARSGRKLKKKHRQAKKAANDPSHVNVKRVLYCC